MLKKQPQIQSKENLKFDKKMINTVSKKINKHICVSGKRSSAFEFLYVFGLVGWGIGVPIVLMAYLGIWLEQNYPSEFISWPLNFVILGFILGTFNAYHWIKKEKIRLDKEDNC